jgi:hypothetical protein
MGNQMEFDWDYTYKVIQRALALRKQKPCRLGVIIVEAGMHYISGAPGDELGAINPHSNKHYYRIDELDRLILELERNPDLCWIDAVNGPRLVRKPPATVTEFHNKTRRIA